jgi:DNA-binding MarR family transcriptional regulator
MLAQLDVNPGQYGALMALGEADRLGQQRLAEVIGVDPRNAVPIIDALAEQGLVSREVDPSDRRRRVLQLTARGRAVAGNLASGAAEIETDLLRPLAPDEQASLRRMLPRHAGCDQGAWGMTLRNTAKRPWMPQRSWQR